MKKFVLFDHDGVVADTGFWYCKAGARALADIGFTLVRGRYVRDTVRGSGSWAQARAAGIGCCIVYKEFSKTRDALQARYRIDTLIELKETILHPEKISRCYST